MQMIIRSLKILGFFLLFFSTASLVSMAAEVPAGNPLADQFQVTVVPKDEWFDLYVGGKVTEQDGVTPISGALVTATYLSDDGIGDITYFDYVPGGNPPYIYRPGTESHCTTGADGIIHLRIDVDAHEAFWEASFNICVTCEGYQNQCLSVDFDYSDNEENRFFYLAPYVEPTPTPTLSAIPTVTPTPGGKPTAVHPELDVDQNGVIGPGDLLLLLQDWLRPVH